MKMFKPLKAYLRNRISRLFSFLLVVISIMLLNGCSLIPKEEEVDATPIISLRKVEYQLEEVKKRDFVYTINGKGYYISKKSLTFSIDIPGKTIQKINVKDGERIKKGDIIIELYKGDLEQRIKEEKVKYQIAELNYNKAIVEKLGTFEIQKAELKLNIERKKLDELMLEYDESFVRSRTDGVISFLGDVNPGDFIYPGVKLFRITEPRNMGIFLKCDDIEQLKSGMEVKLKYNGKEYNGKVAGKSYYTDNNEFAGIWITVDNLTNINSQDEMDIYVNIFNKKDVIYIKKSAIKVEKNKHYVLLLENGARVKRFVETGIESDENIEITKGLKLGEKVILN